MNDYKIKDLERLSTCLDGIIQENKKNTILEQIHEIVPIEYWLNSKYYLGEECDNIFPYWKDVLIDFFTPIYDDEIERKKNILILYGSLGGGKTYGATIVLLRLLYELSCWNHPQLLFGLSPVTKINFVYLYPTREQAENNGLGYARRIIDQSPYFKRNLARNQRKNSSIEFVNNDTLMITSGSEIGHFQGTALFCMIFDEANFMRGSGDIGRLQKAINVYRESMNRRKSRFIHNRVEYGANIICSSADTETSFTEQEIKINKGNKLALMKWMKKYDLNKDDYSKEHFYVFKGDKNVDPFVIDMSSKPKYKSLLQYLKISDEHIKEYLDYKDYKEVKVPQLYENMFVNPPIDFYDTYIQDVYGSLKEVDGVSIQNSVKFFNELPKFFQCINDRLRHPFWKEEIEVSTGVKYNELIENFIKGDDEEEIKRKKEKGKENEIDYGIRGVDGVKYYARFDLAKTGDSAGFALGHYDRKKGKVIIDIQLIIHPPNYPEKIDFIKILVFVNWLKRDRGFNIKKITYDQYQSEFYIQYFNKKRIDSYVLSVERTDEQYKFFKSKIIMNEIEMYYYSRFEFELTNLVHDIGRRKVDHPDKKNKNPKDGGFGKDTVDAVVGVVWSLFINESVKGDKMNETLKDYIKKKKLKQKNSFQNVLKNEQKLLGICNDQIFQEARKLKNQYKNNMKRK